MPPKNKKKKKKPAKTAEEKAEAEAKRSQANRQSNLASKAERTPRELAEEAKEAGNAALAEGDLAAAVGHYTQAIQHDHSNHVYWSNRSAALLKQGNIKGAISDGEMCIEVNEKWGKGYSRLGAALFANGELTEARKIYKQGLEHEPRNQSLLDGLVAAEQKLNPGASADEIVGRESSATRSSDLANGATVTVKGLKGAAQHNGKEAVVQSFEQAKGRYVVKLSTGETVALKPENLEVEAAGVVEEVKVSSKVIGIDLGTTNSCVGVWINDEVQILTSPEGRKTVPSFVSFDGDRRLVGDEAKAMQTRNIANTIYDAKRIIGQQMSNAGVISDIEKFQYKVKCGASDKPVIEVDYQGRKKSFAPEEISAMVLTKMKEIAEDYLGETVTRAVITVPAYFGDGQRAATQAAGRIAGLTVERIINEPTAAALAYGLDKKSAPGQVTNVLVFDLGGGTFDVSILKIEDGIFEVLATGGDTRLGGEDFDLAIVDHLLRVIQKQYNKADLKDNERAVKRLKVAAQEAKEALSSTETYKIVLDGLWEGQDFEHELTRSQFEKLIEPWTKIALETVKKVMRDSKLKVEDVDEVVLVGGSTRVPKMQEDLRAFLKGKELCKEVNPDECVAYGAAVQGAILGGERSDKTSALLLVDVTPLSLGVEVEGKAMSTIVKRNTPIPCVKKGMYTTVEDFQTSIDINIYEGERSHVEGNTQLGEFVISGIERAKRDTAKVEVCFEIDTNGILKVSARDKVTMVENSVVIENAKGRLSSDEVDAMVAEAEKFAAEDKAFVEKLAARSSVEKLAYDLLELGQECEIEKLCDKAKEVRQWLDEVSITGTTVEYNAKRTEMETLMKKLGVR